MGCTEGSNLADNLYSGTLSDTAEPQTITLRKTGQYDYYNLIIEDFYPGDKSHQKRRLKLRFKTSLARGQAGVAPAGASWGVSCSGTSNFLFL